MTILAFGSRLEEEVARLRDELHAGAYRPRPSRRVQIPKGGGGHRSIAVGCVRDRVVQHAFAATMQARLDDELHPSAYAYRRGRSVASAIAAVEAQLAEGKLWVLRGDIDSFFDTIPYPLLMQAVEQVVDEPPVVGLVQVVLEAGALAGGEIADPGIGTPQGSPLSPFLANLYLVPFDRAMETDGFGMVRYGDDFCVCTHLRSEAEKARGVAEASLARLRLRLNDKKVELRHLGEGFVFLGFQPDPCAVLRAFTPNPSDRVARALGVRPNLPAASPPAKPEQPAAPGARPSPAAPDPSALATPPFRELPRAQELYAGCAVLRHFVDQVLGGHGLAGSDRHLVTDILGRPGDQAVPALEAVLRHMADYRPGLGARHVERLYPYPTSCGRIRQKWPDLTSRLRWDCKFRVPPGAYPTPVLHAVGAAETPGLQERVREASQRGGMARAAMAAMNEGRKELGAKAAALCARLTDLRRQQRLLEKAVQNAEADLDAVIQEAGDTPLETPSGTLRRIEQDGKRRFVLEV